MSTGRIEDSYAQIVRAIRLMVTGGRQGFDEGGRLLAEVGEAEATRVLVVMLRDTVALLAEARGNTSEAVLDELAAHNIALTEGLDDDCEG